MLLLLTFHCSGGAHATAGRARAVGAAINVRRMTLITMVIVALSLLAGVRVLTSKMRYIDEKLKAESSQKDRDRILANSEVEGTTTVAGLPSIEQGEVPVQDQTFPDSLNDFYKGMGIPFLSRTISLTMPSGSWVSSANDKPKAFRRSSGHIVVQIVTRAHGHELKHLPSAGV